MRRRRLLALPILVALAAALPIGPGGCGSGGSGGSSGTGAGGHGGAGTGSTGSSGSTGGGGSELIDSGGCVTGEACGDGGICAGGMCCAAALACADTCCSAGDVCSFQKCVTPGMICHDSSDCAPSDYCESSLGDNGDAGAPDGSCMGGVELTGKCLPRPPTCAPDAGAPDGGALDCLEPCEYHPPAGFNPVLKFAWGGQVAPPYSTDIMMTPIVIQLDDDDCDGKITARDIPEIVFSTFTGGAYTAAGTLHAISIVGGKVVDKWSAPGVLNATKQIAGGNIDAQPGNEIVGCGVDGAVHAFHGDGSPMWTSPPAECLMPSIADLDSDGTPEVVVEGAILDGVTGQVKHAFSPPINSSFVVSDLDGDGKLDVITSSRGYHGDGTLFVDTGLAAVGQFDGTSDWKSPWPAVADFDKDGKPEVVVVDNLAHQLSVWRYDPAQPQKFQVVRAPVDLNGTLDPAACAGGKWGNTHGGGPPTVADFDGDGVPDVGLAGGIGYIVFSGQKLVDPATAGPATILWQQATSDCSSASTGSSVFDFDGDGKAEVVYSDENHLRIYEGPTGKVLSSQCNTTATLIEYPVIADVDNDGHADIVVVSNAYAQNDPHYQCNDGVNNAQSGVRVFGDAAGSWVRTRRVWNEHAYHVTNVDEDGTVPAQEAPNWTSPGLNNFRQNKQPGSEFAAPDAVVSIAPACVDSGYALTATVRNIGEAALPAGVIVGFYEGNPPSGKKLGEAPTQKVLYSAESESVTVTIVNPDPDLTSGKIPVYAVVDDTMIPHPSWHECRTDNNTSDARSGSCAVPQ